MCTICYDNNIIIMYNYYRCTIVTQNLVVLYIRTCTVAYTPFYTQNRSDSIEKYVMPEIVAVYIIIAHVYAC